MPGTTGTASASMRRAASSLARWPVYSLRGSHEQGHDAGRDAAIADVDALRRPQDGAPTDAGDAVGWPPEAGGGPPRFRCRDGGRHPRATERVAGADAAGTSAELTMAETPSSRAYGYEMPPVLIHSLVYGTT